MVLTDRDEDDLGYGLLGRLLWHRLRTPDPWDAVRQRFAASGTTPTLTTLQRHCDVAGMSRIPSGVTPLINDRSYRIDAQVSITADDSGVLVAQGDVNGGYVLYLANRRLIYEYNHQGRRCKIVSESPIPPGQRTLTFAFDRRGQNFGDGRLFVDSDCVGHGAIGSTAKYLIGWQGLEIGRDSLSPVSWDYQAPFPFTGGLACVSYDIKDDSLAVTHEVID